ncbi:hypothetical protein JG688_00015489 [Phytophthora aleatoria]|uniref:Tc1-like transposase DDE domain-containing protein n=1 Tax=Phytophthora aleatoria TaxID=2496075 RepID=A0A8J5IJV6_9STRA|nr:hypothetical protein JG688_00015489 [Phytophthora aleatoria]
MSRSVLRRRGWSARNTLIKVSIPFSRGERASSLAAVDVTESFAWGMIDDTFTRRSFHDVFKNKIVPFLNPWVMPRSIVVLDNVKLHMYQELQDTIHATEALLFFLAPLLSRPESDRGWVLTVQAVSPTTRQHGFPRSTGRRTEGCNVLLYQA